MDYDQRIYILKCFLAAFDREKQFMKLVVTSAKSYCSMVWKSDDVEENDFHFNVWVKSLRRKNSVGVA